MAGSRYDCLAGRRHLGEIVSGTAGGGLTAETANVARDSAAPPYHWGLIAGGAVFLLYVVTLSPTTAFWDTSEYHHGA